MSSTNLAFSKYVYIGDIPLWAIAGPEMRLLTNDEQSAQYFSELAALTPSLHERIAIRLEVQGAEVDAPFDSLLVYAAQDDTDVAACIAVRPLLLSSRLASLSQSPKPRADVNPGAASVAASNDEQWQQRQQQPPQLQSQAAEACVDNAKGVEGTKKKSIVNVTRAIQQTVLGALRLRGVRREDPQFKTMYHIISKATEFSFRNRGKEDIDVNDIHEKVEALLAIVE